MILTCRCGRTMTPDGSKSAGHYKCGCGWRVHVSTTKTGQCSAIRSNGHLCTRKADVSIPVQLCIHHLEKLLRADHPLIERALGNVLTLHEIEQQQAEARNQRRQEAEQETRQEREQQRQRALAEQTVVYYVKIGQYIKIGTTTNMKQRMLGLAVDAVLATEPGDRELEMERLTEFADLRSIRREYFWPGERLLDHIEAVRRKYGDPVITNYPKVKGDG